MPKRPQSLFNSQELKEETGKHLPSHQAFLSDPVRVVPQQLVVGDVIRFTYDAEERTVFVLDPEWKNMLHGLSMKKIDRRTLMLEVVSRSDLYKTPINFYKQVVKGEAVQKTDSYRTYDIRKMGDIRRLTYLIDERGQEDFGTEDHHETAVEAFQEAVAEDSAEQLIELQKPISAPKIIDIVRKTELP